MQAECKYPTLLSEINRFKQLHSIDGYLLAFSGGLDSTVLLHILAQDLDCLPKLRALYIDHQIQKESADWAVHCQAICAQWAVPFQSVKVDLGSSTRRGVEALARQARYQALHRALAPHQALLTAHHQRDQAETFILNLSRGSGVAGLASMPYQKKIVTKETFTNYQIRPLLNVPYTELVAYAQQQQLEWVEDPSNRDTHHRRNLIRNELLPQFEQACPNIQQQIARATQHQAEAFDLLSRLAAQDLQTGEYTEYSINLSSYAPLDWPSIKNLLRYWSNHCVSLSPGLQLNFEQLSWIKDYGLDTHDSSASLKLRQGSLKLYRNNLYYVDDFIEEYGFLFTELETHTKPQSSIQVSTQRNNRANSQHTDRHVRRQFELSLPEAWLKKEWETLSVRNIKESDNVNRKRLKTWFQQQGIPPWQRLFWPVVCIDNQPLFLWGLTDKLATQRLFKDENSRSRLQRLIADYPTEQWVGYLLTEGDIIGFTKAPAP